MMSGSLGKTEIATKGWTLAEMVEETRGKLLLKERDATAFYENAEILKMRNKKTISKNRKENKEKHRELSKCINGDEKVIRTALLHRREQLLASKRYTKGKTKAETDQKVCEASKRLNALQHERTECEQQLEKMNSELAHLRNVNALEFDDDREQDIRRIQNEMDKAVIKVGAARNITRKYEAIKESIQTEVRNYPTLLDTLEENLAESLTKLEAVRKMNEKAINASEVIKHDFHTMEREMYKTKRARDQELNVMKKEVEKRKEIADRAEKRPRITLINDTGDSPQAKLQMQRAEQQEKILTLDDAFERIRRATNVSDMDDILFRLTNQDDTYVQLRSMERENVLTIKKLTHDLTKLRTVFETIKYTNEQHISEQRMAVEEMEEYMKEEEKRRNDLGDKYQLNNQLLMNLQFGIATLHDKLKEVKLKPPYLNFSKSDPVVNLQECGRKMDLLMASTAIKTTVAPQVYSEKLHSYLESKLPPDNIRIRIYTEDSSDSDEFLFDHDQENEGFTSREDIKRQGQEILNSKLKPKKKKIRKRNN